MDLHFRSKFITLTLTVRNKNIKEYISVWKVLRYDSSSQKSIFK